MRFRGVLVLASVVLVAACGGQQSERARPRVFVFTDINIDAGDPDDRQSLIHLLWYANELQVEGIVPDRWDAGGYEACELALAAYARDHADYSLAERGYPQPETIGSRVARDREAMFSLFEEAVSQEGPPLYVLVWGNMLSFRDCLQANPAAADRIRLITIGTGVMLESNIPHIPENWPKSPPCEQMNWNAFGRNDIFHDKRFADLWWVEMNWTYEGMFSGPEPKSMLEKLTAYGALGQHMREVVASQEWAWYFRVGDTPSVLYVIDPGHDLDDPAAPSWAGRFARPFPDERPDYYTDVSGAVDWNYADPCQTWDWHEEVRDAAAATLEAERPEMYAALLSKLEALYAR